MLDQSLFQMDAALIAQVLDQYAWATLVSGLPSGPVVSHLPILLEPTHGSAGSSPVIQSHLAREDAELHELGAHEVVVIVQGPHGYVTASHYAGGPYVPTWNFVVVHLHGRPEVLDSSKTYEILDRTVDRLERDRPRPWRLSTVPEYAASLAPHVAGFRLDPARVVGKAKLSQDKPDVDFQGVVAGLISDGDHELATAMQSMVRGRPHP